MNFKEILQEDVYNVFINANEFADIHTLNNTEVKAVVQNEEISGFEPSMDGVTNGNTRGHAKGLFATCKRVYVSAADFGEPVSGSALELDGEMYIVEATAVQCNVIIITLREIGGR